MVAAVDFDDEPTGGGEKIDDALSDDDLPAEGDAELRPSEGVPKLGSNESGLSAESASAMSEELRARGAERAFLHRDLQRRQKRPGGATSSAACMTRAGRLMPARCCARGGQGARPAKPGRFCRRCARRRRALDATPSGLPASETTTLTRQARRSARVSPNHAERA